jgi:hypothetical protein
MLASTCVAKALPTLGAPIYHRLDPGSSHGRFGARQPTGLVAQPAMRPASEGRSPSGPRRHAVSERAADTGGEEGSCWRRLNGGRRRALSCWEDSQGRGGILQVIGLSDQSESPAEFALHAEDPGRSGRPPAGLLSLVPADSGPRGIAPHRGRHGWCGRSPAEGGDHG